MPTNLTAGVNELELVWTCRDTAGRQHVWSFDGRYKRLRRNHPADDRQCLELMYPAHSR